ncbi:hypothetical protein XELAEV_18023674mg, partial [Xenopus laevis]
TPQHDSHRLRPRNVPIGQQLQIVRRGLANNCCHSTRTAYQSGLNPEWLEAAFSFSRLETIGSDVPEPAFHASFESVTGAMMSLQVFFSSGAFDSEFILQPFC